MPKINTIIVDDELDACEGLQLLLSREEDISVISVCRNGREAIKSINQLKPDLIFLDIQMPGFNGFEVLDQLETAPAAIVFTTAYDEYALNAFEVHALDYLQKPFSDERFKSALINIRNRLSVSNLGANSSIPDINEKLDTIQNSLRVKSSGKLFLLQPEEVIWIEGFDYYIKVHTADRFYLVRESLKRILERLPAQFVQVHKSSIVNIGHLRTAEPRARGTYELTLSEGTTVTLSRGYRDQLKGLI